MSSEVIGRLIADFNNLNEKCVHLVEENQNLKQQNQNLQQENQILKENLQEKDKQLEKFQERNKQYEKLEQHVKNLEKQKSDELQQLQQLEIISQNLQNNLGILGSDKAKKNDIKITEKKMFLTNKYDERKKEIMNKPPIINLEIFSGSLSSFNESIDIDTEKSKLYSDIKLVVGLDFGTTSSAFFINIVTKESSGWLSRQKDTILVYNYDYSEVVACGYINKCPRFNIVELFKLHLGSLPDNLKPKLPIEYKRAIADYLKEIRKDIKSEVARRMPEANYFEDVLLVFTVPAEYSEEDKDIMRECIYNAKLIKSKSSEKLQFITESEAAAIYCMENELPNYNLLSIGSKIGRLLLLTGGSTIDITTHKIVGNNPLQLSEVTELIRDFCGSTFIDDEFIKLLNEKFETRAIDLLKKSHYNKFRYIVFEFCQRVKKSFAGDDNTKFSYTLDVEEKIPDLLQYVSEETKKIMEANNWLIDIEYNDIKKLFDPIIDRIIRLIHIQLLNNKETCSAMFLVGGFSGNKYLRRRIEQEFHHAVKIISPLDAISRGAADYGLLLLNPNLNKLGNNDISSSILKYTYGIQFTSDWKDDDPPNRKTSDRKISKFISLVKRGTEVTSDQDFTFNFKPESGQTHAKFEVYYTNEKSATYIDEPGMKLLGVLNVDLPDAHLDNRSINFGLTFGPNKITAFTRNELNGQKFVTKFCYQ
ncbi:hypothetical protein RhiirA1_533414 [Rhizophagus irregularis]|uniref:Hsp70 family protein n=1 Tax=Rhizophagus irregularis TaxID=588596 RepID=A0A2N0S1T3_9GLOM|nr:hypothetical protein RhiirA1_533414 [Rhizophagus irregularis]